MEKNNKKFWINLTIIISIFVAIIGYPVFYHKFGWFYSIFWTIVCVIGVWCTYLIRSYFWSDKK